jgi:hypothetical protein
MAAFYQHRNRYKYNQSTTTATGLTSHCEISEIEYALGVIIAEKFQGNQSPKKRFS